MAGMSTGPVTLQGVERGTKKRAGNLYRGSEGLTPELLIAPLIIIIAIFIYWPLI